MRRRPVCEARVWTSAVPLSGIASTRSGARDRELDGASHTEAGPHRTDGLAALLPDRNPSAQLGRVYACGGSCLAATSERPRADRRADFKRPDERRLSYASRIARIGGVIQERTLRPASPSNPPPIGTLSHLRGVDSLLTFRWLRPWFRAEHPARRQ